MGVGVFRVRLQVRNADELIVGTVEFHSGEGERQGSVPREIPLDKRLSRVEHSSMPQRSPKYGARVFKLSAGRLLVKQTVLRGVPAEYVIDEQRERHVDEGNDTAIAEAIRAAVRGRLR